MKSGKLAAALAFLPFVAAAHDIVVAADEQNEERVFAVEATWRPRERWRGFNIYDKAKKGSFSGVWREDDIRMIHELGFNFVRVMIDYRFWCRDDDWTKPDPAKFPAIDEIIGWGRKYQVHTQICFSTPPGINHETRSKERLFFDPVAQEAMETHWRYFARRYRDLPNDEVTFNLFNEPTSEATEESYTALVKKLVAAIHAEDPKRFIVIDGLLWGRRPLLGAIGLPVGQSHHAYVPMNISHYKAGWIKGSDSWSVPTWPPSPAVSPLFGSRKPEDKQRPFVVNDVKAGTLVLNVKLVNREAELIVEADGQPLFSRLYRPSPNELGWTNLVARDGGKEWAGRLVEPIRIAVPDCKRLSVRLGRGDWMEMDSFELSSGGKTVSLPFVSDWQVLRHELRFAGYESPQPFLLEDGSAYTGDTYLDGATSAFWKPVLDAGQFVMVGETGVINKTPHDVSLRWLEDNLRRWKEKGIGWAMWNFRGSMGILDSKRDDVKYEDYQGHKLDRKMLELLQRY